MKILSIHIKNLASLEGEFEIDFTKEPLRSAGIFAITGPTGAGKSTILDALCLALFAKTPRHTQAKESGIEIADGAKDKISPGDVKSILRKGTGEGFAQVSFVGTNGVKYRSVWAVKRARNKIDGSLQADTLDLTNLETNTRYPGKKTETLKEIERLIGLNFDQFTRSVLLAQGDFIAFLKAEKKEKSSLLEKLTGTDIYSEISKRIYQRSKESEQEVKDLERQIEGIKLLNNEEIANLTEQLQILHLKITSMQAENIIIVSELNWHDVYSELAAGKEIAEKELSTAKQNKAGSLERINKFWLVDSIQNARTIAIKKDAIEKNISIKTNELIATEATIVTNEKELHAATSQYSRVLTLFNKVENEYDLAKPLIEKAKQSDTLIKEKKEQTTIAQNEVKQTAEKKQNHYDTIANKEQVIEKIMIEISTLKDWKEKNSAKQPVAENKMLILSKLDDAKKQLIQGQQATTKIEICIQKGKINNKEIVLLEDKLNEKNKTLQDITDEFNDIQNKLSSYKIEELKAFELALNNLLATIIDAAGCWELLFKNISDLEKCNEKLQNVSKAFSEDQIQLINVKKEKDDATLKRDLSYKLLNKARLETAKDVVSLRTQLLDNDACPVCGSIHHPYVAGNAPPGNILAILEDEYVTHKNLYESLLKQRSSLEKQIENDKKSLVDLWNDETGKKEEIAELKPKWLAYNIDETCFRLPDNEKSVWLQKKKNATINLLDSVQNEMKQYDVLVAGLDRQKNISEQMKLDIRNLDDKLKDELNTQQIILSELAGLTHEKAKYDTHVEEITSELNPYFNIHDWRENWQKQPGDFEEKISSFAEEWKNKTTILESRINNKTGYDIELRGLNNQLENFVIAENNANKNLTEKAAELTNLLNTRKALFNNRDIALVEQEFNTGIENAKKQLDDLKLILDTLTAQASKLLGKKQQIEADLKIYQQSLIDCENEITAYIKGYNNSHDIIIDEPALLDNLNISDEWILKEKKWMDVIENAIRKSETMLQERNLQYANHLQKRRTDKTKEELQQRQQEVKAGIEIQNKEKNDVEYSLRQNMQKIKHAGSIIEELNKYKAINENRQKLNDLLGSADGEKFRQIAQEYTLDILLGFANIHLKDLACRYKLERILNSLALQVIDKDMGDEIRSVHSLSGGESFLVSLALALGLASLSSNKMKVESLFIDEGFGSLDAATLGIAMDALESLYNQGRKVGVISHVREMTERIHTQIKVIKLSNGKSKLEVVG